MRIYDRKYHFNEQAFDKIDSQDKAYWLGFLLGDGHISHYSLIVELSIKDKGHLQKLIKFMNGNNVIQETRKNCCVVKFNSVLLVKSLNKYMCSRKTYADVLTPKLNKKYLPHFYRGLLDSDGWIAEHKNKRSGRSQYEFGFSSYNVGILKEIQAWLIANGCTSKGYIITRKRENQQVSQFIIGGANNFSKIYHLFYDNSNYYLDRKFLKASHFYNLITSRI